MKKRNKFKLVECHKEGFISTPHQEFRIQVDLDDVDTLSAATYMQKMLAILNDHWDDRGYANLEPPPYPDNCTDEQADERYEAGQKLLKSLLKYG